MPSTPPSPFRPLLRPNSAHGVQLHLRCSVHTARTEALSSGTGPSFAHRAYPCSTPAFRLAPKPKLPNRPRHLSLHACVSPGRIACEHRNFGDPAVPFAGFSFNDLHAYDPANRTWTNLSDPLSGQPPSPRESHGLIAAGGRLYVMGGFCNNDPAGERRPLRCQTYAL